MQFQNPKHTLSLNIVDNIESEFIISADCLKKNNSASTFYKMTNEFSEHDQLIDKMIEILQRQNDTSKKLKEEDLQILLKVTERMPFFSYMNKKEYYRNFKIHQSCMNKLTYRKYHKGDILFMNGDTADFMCVLLKGAINIYTTKSADVIQQEISIANTLDDKCILNFNAYQKHKQKVDHIDKEKIADDVVIPINNDNFSNKYNMNYNILVSQLDVVSSESSSGLSIDEDHEYEIISNEIKKNDLILLNNENHDLMNDYDYKLNILARMLGGINPLEIPHLTKLFTDKILNVTYKATMQSGKILGSSGLLKGKPRKYAAICYEDCEVGLLTRLNYQQICYEMIDRRRRDKINFIWNKTFSGMTREQAAILAEMMTKHKFGKSRKIYKEGDHPDGFYILKHGEIQLKQKVNIIGEFCDNNEDDNDLDELNCKKPKKYPNASCRQNTVCIVEAGEFFGEEELLEKIPRCYTAIVASKFATVYFIRRDVIFVDWAKIFVLYLQKIRAFLSENPKFKDFLKEKLNSKQKWQKLQEKNQIILATAQYIQREEQIKSNAKAAKNDRETEIIAKENGYKEHEKPERRLSNIESIQLNTQFKKPESDSQLFTDRDLNIVPKINFEKIKDYGYDSLNIGDEIVHYNFDSFRPKLNTKSYRKRRSNSVLKKEKTVEMDDEPVPNGINPKINNIINIITNNEKRLAQLTRNDFRFNELATQKKELEKISDLKAKTPHNGNNDNISLPLIVAKKIEKMAIRMIRPKGILRNMKPKHLLPNDRKLKAKFDLVESPLSKDQIIKNYYMAVHPDWKKYTTKSIMSAITKPQSLNNSEILETTREALSLVEKKVPPQSIFRNSVKVRERKSILTADSNRKGASSVEFIVEKTEKAPAKVNMHFINTGTKSYINSIDHNEIPEVRDDFLSSARKFTPLRRRTNK